MEGKEVSKWMSLVHKIQNQVSESVSDISSVRQPFLFFLSSSSFLGAKRSCPKYSQHTNVEIGLLCLQVADVNKWPKVFNLQGETTEKKKSTTVF